MGGLVVRYLRLHKPAKQRLRMSKARAVLAELVPDIRRAAATRKGREWAAPLEAWQAAFAAVFDAQAGTLELPLEGNAYLYEVLLRQGQQGQSSGGEGTEQQARGRTYSAGASSVADVIGGMDQALERAGRAVDALSAPHIAAPAPSTGPGLYARKLKAQAAARQAATHESPSHEHRDPDQRHPGGHRQRRLA